MSYQEKSCGTCRWWIGKVIESNLGQGNGRFCQHPNLIYALSMQRPASIVGIKTEFMYEVEGDDCQCWEVAE